MADVLTPDQRSKNMSRIHAKDTTPEIRVRQIVYEMGFRYRLHRSDLPGKPDLVFSGSRKLIFVHGCYWHVHRCRFGRVVPKTNEKFWFDKRSENVLRDRRQLRTLRREGWTVLVVWECWVRDTSRLKEVLTAFLSR